MPADNGEAKLRHKYNDGASNFWSIYVTEAEQHDKNLTDTWKADMDSTLIFAGLFSAVITAFIIDGYKLLQSDSSNATVVLLNQILTVQIASYTHNNSSIPNLPVPIPSSPSMPKPSVIAINILWFLSLAFSLIAALMVILAQQWIRHYLQQVAHHPQPLRRSRTRSLLFDGVENWKLQSVVGYVPALLHVSLFLFLSGLCVFLFQISLPVAWPFLVLVVIFVLLYGVTTLTPIHDLSSPFETPLSSVSWFIFASLRNIKLHSSIISYTRRILKPLTFWKPSRSGGSDLECAPTSSQRGLRYALNPDVALPMLSLNQHLAVARRQYALNPVTKNEDKSLKMDAQAFIWALKRTIDDSELEKFAESIPGFLSSDDGRMTWTLVHDMFSQPSADHNSVSPLVKLEHGITRLLHSVATSGNVDAVLRRRRGMSCQKALFTISLYQITLPDRKPPIPYTIPSNVMALYTVHEISRDTFWDDEVVTMALCNYALLLYRRPEMDLPRWEGSYGELYDRCIMADKLLRDIEDLDQLLVDVFNEAKDSPLTETGKADVSNLLLTYINVLDKKSCELATCAKYVADHILDDSFGFSFPDRLQRFLTFPILCSKREPEQELAVSENLLFGHQLLALMRCHGFYPSLPVRTRLVSAKGIHSWLHVNDAKLFECDPTSPFQHLLLELQPITSLVHLIGSFTQPISVELCGSSSLVAPGLSLNLWSRAFIEATYQDLQPESIASFGPFRLLASFLQDPSTKRLLTLTRTLHDHASLHIFHPDASTISTTIGYLFPDFIYKPSAVFAAAVESILTRERDSKLSQNEALSLLYSKDVTDHLVGALAAVEVTDLRLNIISMFGRVYGFQVDIDKTDENSWRTLVYDIQSKRHTHTTVWVEGCQ